MTQFLCSAIAVSIIWWLEYTIHRREHARLESEVYQLRHRLYLAGEEPWPDQRAEPVAAKLASTRRAPRLVRGATNWLQYDDGLKLPVFPVTQEMVDLPGRPLRELERRLEEMHRAADAQTDEAIPEDRV